MHNNGCPHEVLALFNEIHVKGVKPNSNTIFNVVHIFLDLLALERGEYIHVYAIIIATPMKPWHHLMKHKSNA
jgi:hypothetical protein